MFSQSKKLWQGVGAGAALALACSVPQTAQAGGLEDTVGGAIGLGRSAYFARVNDFMAVLQNPANLAVIPGGDLSAELRLPLLSQCYDRIYNPNQAALYKKDAAGNLAETFDQVCDDAFPMPTGNIGWARSFDNGWGWGIGLFTPAAAGGHATFGSDTNLTLGYDPAAPPERQEKYTPTLTGTMSPTRQMGIERDGAIAYLMMGVAYEPVKQIRFGVSAGIGFANIYNKNMVSSVGGNWATYPEIVNELHVKDLAIPRATASLVIAPARFMDIVGAVAYVGDINATGYSDLTANGISGVPRGDCYSSQQMPPVPTGSHCRINGAKLYLPQPTWEATGGIRFSHRRHNRERVLDPMKDEIWDIEVNGVWTQTSHVDEFRATLHDQIPGTPGAPTIQMNNREMQARDQPIQGVTSIPKKWKDSWTVRAGADWNVIEEKLAIRVGGSYSPRAVDPGYMNTDFAMPVQKIGVHAGMTVAAGNYKLTLGYAHLFYETIDVAIGQGQVKEITAVMKEAALTVNEGRFSGGLDVFSLQLNARF
jgi:opacity protein-like surface antigen